MSLRYAAAVVAVAVAASLSTVAPSAAATAPTCAPPARAGAMACFAVQVGSGAAVVPDALPPGYGPKDLQSAYKLPAGGAGATVAVVDAYNDPDAAADLATYRSTFGQVACTVASGCFRQVNQRGAASPLPPNNAGWAGEESLDVDMVSAVCPKCHILLVEADSAAAKDLYAAVDEAVTLGARFVSTSWGASETSSQVATGDPHFNHPGVAITAASGSAGVPSYPGASQYVTAVGGTTLVRSSATSRGWAESAWGGSGYGCSLYDPKAPWQTVTTTCARRAVSDVAAVADPNDPVAVYQTFGASGWVEYGGGSVPPPIIAAVYAPAGTPVAGTYPASYPYAHPGGLFDITTGPSGSCGPPLCQAGPGWDGPTGLGTPDGTPSFMD